MGKLVQNISNEPVYGGDPIRFLRIAAAPGDVILVDEGYADDVLLQELVGEGPDHRWDIPE